MEYVIGTVQHLKDSDISLRKLAASLHGLVTTAAVNCDESPKLCKLFDRTSGVICFWQIDAKKPDEIREIDSLDYKEIAAAVLKHAPGIPYIEHEHLKRLVEGYFFYFFS
ncbi:unnamed protein product [Gongylonema pulchrum]|uniref:Transcriptional regulator n=1 Tax=Gongylonema pulchrum TaxID=637853 RepID=A0A183DEM9_9BILA|nr:unnamed protein product [Gongylonema pulchrum]